MKLVSLLLTVCLLTVTTPFILAQTASSSAFRVETLVSDGKKSREVKSTLSFLETSFKTSDRKTGAIIKELNYADVKAADYSFARKPLVSTTQAVVGTILLGPLFLVTLFIKKKQHWLSVRTESDYAVMKLNKDDFRQIMNEFEIRKVTVTTVNEDEKAEKRDPKSDKDGAKKIGAIKEN